MKKILIDKYPTGINVSLLEGNRLIEFHVEQASKKNIVGNIYKGKVENVLKGMQAAFVNIGLNKNVYLFSDDILSDNPNETLSSNIKLNIAEGDQIMCQIVKDEFGNKCAKATMNISLPGRFLVLITNTNVVVASKKIENDDVKNHLTTLVNGHKQDDIGFIIRTEAQFATDEEIISEIVLLQNLYKDIYNKFLHCKPMNLIYQDEDIIKRVIRDLYKKDIDEIETNDKEIYDRVLTLFPNIVEKCVVKYNDSYNSIVYKNGIHSQALGILEKRVDLSNGGYIVIESTEALTVVDVNTGKYVGDKNLEETAYNTNCIAAVEVARQLRLRNIGGIIVVDFIDMNIDKNKESVLSILEDELKKDRMHATLAGMTNLGLVEITRKKVKQNTDIKLHQACPYCSGTGRVRSDELILMILKDALVSYVIAHPHTTATLVKMHPDIVHKVFSINFFKKEAKTIFSDKIIYLIPDDEKKIFEYSISSANNIIIDLPDNARLLY